MRTNIDLDDEMMAAAMRAGPFTTKRDAVHAGLALLARRAAWRDLLALRGQLEWSDADEEPGAAASRLKAAEPRATYDARSSRGVKAAKSRSRRS